MAEFVGASSVAQSDDLQSLFKLASGYVRGLKNLSDEQMLQFYGLYKQSLDGKCTTSKPPFWDFVGKSKWEAWKKLGDMNSSDAMTRYIKLVAKISPNWEEELSKDTGSNKGQLRGMGVAVSIMAKGDEDDIRDEEKSAFDWCKDGKLQELKNLLQSKGVNINTKDENGMTLLHWAADRGHGHIVKYLIENRADLNTQDAELQTALHFAVVCEYPRIVELLLKSGADRNIRDSDDQMPVDYTENLEIKHLLECNA